MHKNMSLEGGILSWFATLTVADLNDALTFAGLVIGFAAAYYKYRTNKREWEKGGKK